jgi:hypothetical protein
VQAQLGRQVAGNVVLQVEYLLASARIAFAPDEAVVAGIDEIQRDD